MTTNTSRWIRLSLMAASMALVSACATSSPESVPCTILQQTSVCVAVPVHDDLHDDEAKAFTPAPEGSGYMYITRPYAQQRSTKSKIFVDGVFLAELGPKTFARIKMRPGTHTVKVTADKIETVSISVDMQKEAFLEYQIAEHFFSTEPSIKSVSRERAKDSVQPLDLVLTKID
ncbi:DUF2846 domain-containing protein [Herbaspirillum huttiense]|uniref:DUF2846 domain-containing protein n=1 Tax=Herbaspirillum TaxID=963 RepID=UPI0010659197|nr:MULTISPECIES: DUF2846 domain-containing protein [Herbaspirillum]MCI1016750.1 DUF2846 domain-containing protein [Herbaspirillum sp. C7C2]QBP73596.1 DUF2846 domain-containing protein [Herbaspirillum huttiense]